MEKTINKKWKRILFLLILLFTFLLVACNSDKSATKPETSDKETGDATTKDESEPVTLKVHYGWEEEFIEDIKEPVEEKFPNITLEFTEVDFDAMDDDIAKGNIPDIFYLSGGGQLKVLEEYELSYDLDELVEKNSFDLNKIDKAQIDKVRSWGEGKLYYFPYVKRWDVLYYNKGIFDLFGVNYPQDGMTWDEIADLARKVNGEVNGTNYRGIDISSTGAMLNQLGVQHVDPETDESMYLQDERFAKFLNKIENIASIPGVIPEDEGDWGNFINEQNVAMVPLFDVHIWLSNVEAETGLDWNMVSYPVWEDQPKIGPSANAAGLSISETSEHKDAAFQVLEYLMSDEWQMMRSKKGFATVLNNSEVQEAFSSEIEGLKDKNMQAVFDLEAAEAPEKVSAFEEDGEILDAMEFIEKEQDVNTYLRETYEEAEAKIKEAKGSN
ncbi:ABC transporter substrate-binding protein [Bacillus sp. SD088]|uniref:ABC transporter substrate-binding protein n=1 Tax=Bacillus sp. SD088 TaxID=2782012 RepID=UPI001A968C1E|nr:extracellular solute-binding protein [Bacillus sp. SD088]MBO0995666.1 extracellular solute-binding protein [Bacillus sp. SD088]